MTEIKWVKFPKHETSEKIESAVVVDEKSGEISLVVSGGALVDKTGVYSVECEFGY